MGTLPTLRIEKVDQVNNEIRINANGTADGVTAWFSGRGRSFAKALEEIVTDIQSAGRPRRGRPSQRRRVARELLRFR
jgi:hypothetical protein